MLHIHVNLDGNDGVERTVKVRARPQSPLCCDMDVTISQTVNPRVQCAALAGLLCVESGDLHSMNTCRFLGYLKQADNRAPTHARLLYMERLDVVMRWCHACR